MKFGIHNPSWLFEGGPSEIFAHISAKAQWAENNGFTWFSVMDHLIQIDMIGSRDEPFMEGWTTLAALAAVTSKIRLATLVSSVAYRNPALLAKMATTLDVISRGRATLGIGAGWFDAEYAQYGYEFPPAPAKRIRQMEEAVKLIRNMWAQSRATFDGKYFRTDAAILEPKPLQRPQMPIMIGGGGEKMTLRAVARLGDACNIGGDPETVRRKFAILRTHCEAAERPYEAIERTAVTGFLIAENAGALAAKRAKYNVTETNFRGYAMTTEEARSIVHQYADAGTQTLICTAHKNDAETLAILARDIMPAFT